MKTFVKTSKVYLLAACLTAVTFSSCGYFLSTADHENEISALNESQLMMVDSIHMSYQSNLDDIENALDEIRTNYGFVELGPNSNVELSQPQVERIGNNLNMVAEVLDENRTKIQMLESKVEALGIGKTEINSSLKHLKQKLEDMQWQYDALKEEYAKREIRIRDLESNLSYAEESVSTMYRQMRTSEEKAEKKYLAFGTKKLLKETKVIKKDGKLFGNLVVNENMDPAELMPVNMYQNTSISFDTPHPTIVSAHPSESYTLENTTDGCSLLLINNPDLFWKTSNILVVATN